MIRERDCPTISGWLMLPALLIAIGLSLWQLVANIATIEAETAAPTVGLAILLWIVAIVVLVFLLAGFFVVNPNEARVMTLFGRYSGSVKRDGFHWANPFFHKRRISLRIRNFESAQIKVNDLEGNPIEIAAVVVWR